MNPYLLWILIFPLQLALSIFCKLTTPIVCLFVTKELRTDRVKRFNNEVLTFDRYYLIKPFRLWQTHDNALCEYWFGAFNSECVLKWVREAKDEDFNKNWFLRYTCFCLWVWRNTGYGFAYRWWGRDTKTQTWFQLKKDIPLGFGYYSKTNIGWKINRSAPDPTRAMYAGGLIRIRKTKE